MHLRAGFLSLLFVAWSATAPAWAQEAGPTTRTEAIEQERREKIARLWPEHENPLVKTVNNLVERGFREGLDSGRGHNGLQ